MRETKVFIRGEVWTIRLKRFKEDHGQTIKDDRLIEIDPRVPREQWLGILVHEALHAALWDLDEGVVCEVESAIVNAVRRGSALLELGASQAEQRPPSA